MKKVFTAFAGVMSALASMPGSGIVTDESAAGRKRGGEGRGKRRIGCALVSLLLCAALLPCPASGAGAVDDAFKEMDKAGYSWKIKGKWVKQPPYSMKFEWESGGYAAGDVKLRFSLVGTRDPVGNNKISGDWDFSLNAEYSFETDWHDLSIALSQGEVGVYQNFCTHEFSSGQVKAAVTTQSGEVEKDEYEFEIPPSMDQEAKQAKRESDRQKLKDKLARWNALSYEEQRAQMRKEQEEAEAKASGQPPPIPPPPKEAFKTSFTLPASFTYGADSRALIVYPTSKPWERISTITYTDLETYWGDSYNIEISIDSSDVAKAKITWGKEDEMNLTGKLTYGYELEMTRKASKSYPIWGSWTDKDVYAPFPAILDDYKARQKEIEAREEDPTAKVTEILYNNGKWLTLTKLKKAKTHAETSKPASYELVEITDKFIRYEKGEIWPSAALFTKPALSYRFPRDHQDNEALYSLPLEKYAQMPVNVLSTIRYVEMYDTLWVNNGIFMPVELQRVRDMVIMETWSSVEDVKKPTPKNLGEVAGTWYEFSLRKGEYVDGADENGLPVKLYKPTGVGGFVFEKVTVERDGAAEILIGAARLLAFEQMLECDIEKRIVISAAGARKDESYGLDEDGDPQEDFDYEDFVIRYADYDKDTETIKLNDALYYNVTKATLDGIWSTDESSLNGTWCNDKSAPKMPDISDEDARELLRQEYGEYIMEWHKFDASAREFTRLYWAPGYGILEEKGSFKALGDASLVLYRITGSYYDLNDELLFEDKACPDPDETLVYEWRGTDLISVSSGGVWHKVK